MKLEEIIYLQSSPGRRTWWVETADFTSEEDLVLSPLPEWYVFWMQTQFMVYGSRRARSVVLSSWKVRG